MKWTSLSSFTWKKGKCTETLFTNQPQTKTHRRTRGWGGISAKATNRKVIFCLVDSASMKRESVAPMYHPSVVVEGNWKERTGAAADYTNFGSKREWMMCLQLQPVSRHSRRRKDRSITESSSFFSSCYKWSGPGVLCWLRKIKHRLYWNTVELFSTLENLRASTVSIFCNVLHKIWKPLYRNFPKQSLGHMKWEEEKAFM